MAPACPFSLLMLVVRDDLTRSVVISAAIGKYLRGNALTFSQHAQKRCSGPMELSCRFWASTCADQIGEHHQ